MINWWRVFGHMLLGLNWVSEYVPFLGPWVNRMCIWGSRKRLEGQS